MAQRNLSFSPHIKSGQCGFCAVISDPDSLHFMAPVGSPSPVLGHLHLLANTGPEEPVEDCVGDFVGHS